MKKLIYFLGSIYLAIILLTLSALFVIAGTFLESITQSHQYAALFTYGNPLFKLLLCGFFVNILVSALGRWPFQKRHIPFLITHLGLLMLLAGAFIKVEYGVQGNMGIFEGSGSEEIFLPNTYAIRLEGRDSTVRYIPLEKGGPFENVTLTLIDFVPHASQQLQTYIGGKAVTFNNDALPEALEGIRVYDRGFGGYTAIVKGPPTPERKLELLKEQLRAIPSDVTWLPPLEMLKKAALQAGEEPASVIVSFLDVWHQQGGWLYRGNVPEKLQNVFEKIEWTEEVKKGSQIASFLFKQMEEALAEGQSLKDFLQKSPWWNQSRWEHFDLLTVEEQENELQDMLWVLTQQVYLLTDEMSFPLENSLTETARWISAYLRAYGVDLMSVELVENHEAPLKVVFEEQAPLQKLEDNLPKVTLKIEEEGKAQYVTLGYDPYGTGLKWPVLDGKYLVSFQNEMRGIPYRLRLRDARQITYPQSAQPYSYESDIIVTDLTSGKSVETTLMMNKVYETHDGYRFYLSNIIPKEPVGVQEAIIVVNRDPAKYWLTYPGAIILTLGILLLFWLNPYSR